MRRVEIFGWLRKRQKRPEQESVRELEVQKTEEERKSGKGEENSITAQFAEVISRLTSIQEQMAKEKSLSEAAAKFDADINSLNIFLQREFEKLGVKEKEDAVRKSERLVIQKKGQILAEKIGQSLKDQRLTFTELEQKIQQNSEISFSRGLFSQVLQKLISENALEKEEGKYFLK